MTETSKTGTITTITTRSAEQTRLLGKALANFLNAGDLLILEGELGAGKTTFTQGLGAGLAVKQRVTSPTFIIARTHPSPRSGKPQLVHVDAYRLEGGDDVEALNLESALENSVVVVEWGRGKVEGISAHTLELDIERPQNAEIPLTGTIADIPDDTACAVTFRQLSGSWNLDGLEENWRQLLTEAAQETEGENESDSEE